MHSLANKEFFLLEKQNTRNENTKPKDFFFVFVARYRYSLKLAWSLQRKSPLIVTYISQNSVHLDLTQTGKLFRTKIDSPSLSHLISASFPHIYHFHLSEGQFHLLTHHLANGHLSH